jgi:hypothetical protein
MTGLALLTEVGRIDALAHAIGASVTLAVHFAGVCAGRNSEDGEGNGNTENDRFHIKHPFLKNDQDERRSRSRPKPLYVEHSIRAALFRPVAAAANYLRSSFGQVQA